MNGEIAFHEAMTRLRARDDAVAADVFRRFVHRLVCLARTRLHPRVRTRIDPEDVVQSVFRSFFRRSAEGQFEFADWDSLWHVLAFITVRKCANKCRRLRTDVLPPGEVGDDVFLTALDREPTPDEAGSLLDTLEGILIGLQPRERDMVVLRLQGYDTREVSTQLGCTQRKVQRVLQHARERLEQMDDHES